MSRIILGTLVFHPRKQICFPPKKNNAIMENLQSTLFLTYTSIHPISYTYFCMVKETISKTNGQPTEWEKIFAYHIFVNGLMSKIYKITYSTP